MCLGIEAILGAVTSLVGTAASMSAQKEAEARAQRQAEARNNEMKRTLRKNDEIADQSRDRFNARVNRANQEQMEQDQAKAQENRETKLEEAVLAVPEDGTVAAPITGSAPAVVKSELAKRMGDAVAQGKNQAKALAQLSAYGDSWLNQGFLDQAAGRDIGVSNNFAAGNMAVLPYAQDFAEHKASFKKNSNSPVGNALKAGATGAFYGGA